MNVRGKFIAVVFPLVLLACGWPIETVSIDEIYWSAFRSPETFDDDHDALVKDSRTTSCLYKYRDNAFKTENDQLLECDQIVAYTLLWNDCHDKADTYHNQGVFFNDVARTVEGSVRFDETQSYLYVILSKSPLSDADWNNLVDNLQEITPELTCGYKGDFEYICSGDCEYVWE